MAVKTIAELTSTDSIAGTDVLVIDDGEHNYKITWAALKALIATVSSVTVDNTAGTITINTANGQSFTVTPHDPTKQDTLTFDDAPTANSNNPVKSGGVKSALDLKLDSSDYTIFTGASGGTAGTAGIVPAPFADGKYLASDGSWETPDATPTASSRKLTTSGGIRAAVEDVRGVFAGEYDATETYRAHDHVLHEGGMYVCLTNIDTAEAWTDTHWALVKAGDEIGTMKRNAMNVYTNPFLFERGAISSSSGANSSSGSSTRLRTIGTLPEGICRIGVNSGYKYVLMAYDGDDYLGCWNGTDFQTSSAYWWTEEVTLSAVGDHRFRLVVANNRDTSINVSDAVNLLMYSYADRTLTQAGKAADAKAVGAVIAPEYDATATYKALDYVLYNGDLYVCVTDIDSAEDFTKEHWASATLGTGLSSLAQQFDLLWKLEKNRGLSAADVDYISSTGRAAEFFDIGDVIYIPWTDRSGQTPVEYEYPFIVADIKNAESGDQDHPDPYENAIWLMAMYAYAGTIVSYGSSNRYSQSDVRTWLNSDDSTLTVPGFLSGFDADWQGVFKTTRVYTVVENREGYTAQTDETDDKMFIMSSRQAYGNASSGVGDLEGTYFPWWKTATGYSSASNGFASSPKAARRIGRLNSPSSYSNIWLRSPTIDTANNVYRINSAGYIDNTAYTHNYSTLPCCVI